LAPVMRGEIHVSANASASTKLRIIGWLLGFQGSFVGLETLAPQRRALLEVLEHEMVEPAPLRDAARRCGHVFRHLLRGLVDARRDFFRAAAGDFEHVLPRTLAQPVVVPSIPERAEAFE